MCRILVNLPHRRGAGLDGLACTAWSPKRPRQWWSILLELLTQLQRIAGGAAEQHGAVPRGSCESARRLEPMEPNACARHQPCS